MSKGILVLGAESSGNRYMTRLLISAGCDGNAEPPYNDVEPRDGLPFVWLRSVPYRQTIPDLHKLITDAWSYTDDVEAVVMLRDMYPSLMSQVKIRHAPDMETARQRTENALCTIFQALGERAVPFLAVTYSGLVNHTPDVVKWVTSELGLDMPEKLESAYDGDLPWWREREARVEN